MGKHLNKRIIVAGVVALLLIWAYLILTGFERAQVYIWLLLSGGIFLAIAVNSIAISAENAADKIQKAKQDAGEPKLSMKEFLEYIKSCGKIITDAELSELVDKRSKRIDLNYLERLIKDMGYNVIAVCEGCIYFCGKHHDYKLYTRWMRDSQTNYMWVRVKYRVHKEDMNKYVAIAHNLTKEIETVKAFVTPSTNEKGEYRIEIAADTLYSGNERVDGVILSLIYHIQLAEQRMTEMRKEMKEEFNN